MLSFSHRFSAVLLTLALAAGQLGVCAGWMPSPEARMACCADDGQCPMHKSGSKDYGITQAVTQAEADRCCAASEQDDSTPSPASIAFLAPLDIAPVPVAALLPESETHAGIWRVSVPIPVAHVPKHVLLSVFLV